MSSESAPPAEESSLNFSKFSLPAPQVNLAAKITADWQWLAGVYESYTHSSNTALRANCTSTRVRVQSALEELRNVQMRTELTMSNLMSPPTAMVTYKESALDFRRNYAAFIVAGITVVSALPALRAGPGRLEKLRIAARNFVCAGSAASVLVYPEFAFDFERDARLSVMVDRIGVGKMLPKL